MGDFELARGDEHQSAGARTGDAQLETAPLPAAMDRSAATNPTRYLLHLQRAVGNQTVGQLLRGSATAPAIQRVPGDGEETGTAKLHAAIYGDSSLAHAPTAVKPAYLVSTLVGRAFPWDSQPEPRVPTVKLINDWLDFYNFHELRPLGANPDGCDFNLSIAFNVDNVANIFMVDSKAAGFAYGAGLVRDAIVANLRVKQAARAKVETTGSGETGADKKDDKKDDDTSTQMSIGWTFVPKTIHTDVQKGDDTKDPPTLQVSGQFTLQLHKDGQRGFELSAGVQASFFRDPGAAKPRLQNFSAVGQAAWVTPFFSEFIQLQAVAQVLVGSNFVVDQPVADKFVGPRLQPAAQVAAGPQIVFTIPGTDKHLQVLGQLQGSLSTAGGTTTVDRSAGIGVQWVF